MQKIWDRTDVRVRVNSDVEVIVAGPLGRDPGRGRPHRPPHRRPAERLPGHRRVALRDPAGKRAAAEGVRRGNVEPSSKNKS